MKLFITFFSFALIISSCSMPTLSITESFETPEEAMQWVYENINYTPDYYDEWQTPDETLSIGSGDCEDFSSLLVALWGEGEIVGFVLNNSGHMVARIDGKYYDATLNRVKDSIPDKAEIVKELTLQSYYNSAVFR